ncbi:MAG: DEAD/DEAH box helicase [Elusimicrobiota bacterium]
MVIEVWERKYGKELLPIQERVFKETSFLRGKNLIVFAPTSSGKTFIGEMKAVIDARKRKKVIYLVPQKALAEEKYEEFRNWYLPLDIKTVVSTHDRREYDEDIEKCRFDIAVVVYEKLISLLVHNGKFLNDVSLIVVDELQMIGEEERGPVLEMFLTRLLLSEKKPQIVGLSAVLGKCEKLAEWLNAELLYDDKRPVELRQGVFHRGIFRYQEHNSKKEGQEVWIKKEVDKFHEILSEQAKLKGRDEEKIYRDMVDEFHKQIMIFLAKHLAEKGEQVIMFLKDKRLIHEFANKLAEIVNLPEAKEAIDELNTYEDTVIKDFLIKLLKKGICIHHADLNFEQRNLVERYYKKGEIRILLATSTLAYGLNLPAKSAIIDLEKWYTNPHKTDRPVIVKLSKIDFENMGGRVGRYGYISDFGRAILVTMSSFHVDGILDEYVKSGFEEVKSAMDSKDMDKHILNLFASGLCHTSSEVKDFLLHTFASETIWKKELTDQDYDKFISQTIDYCIKGELITQDNKGIISVTKQGEVASQKGIHVETALSMLEWLKKTEPGQFSTLELLIICGLTPDAEQVYIPLSWSEYEKNKYRNLLKQVVYEQELQDRKFFTDLLNKYWEYRTARGIKKALSLFDWISSRKTSEIEKQFETHSGVLQRAGEEFSWLVETISALAETISWPEDTLKRINEISRQLIYGLPKQGLELSSLRIPGLGRGYLTRLIKEGFDTVKCLTELSQEIFMKLLPKTLAKKIYQHFHPETVHIKPEKSASKISEKRETYETKSETTEKSFDPQTQVILAIDYNQPDVIIYKGQAVKLNQKQFQLINILVKSPGDCVSYQTIYNQLWTDLSSTSPLQIQYHKSQLLTKIKQAVSHERDVNNFIITIPKEGLKLNLRKEDIKINGLELVRFKNIDIAQLNRRQIEAYRKMFLEKKKLTIQNYCSMFGITKRTALRDLTRLLETKIINKQGRGRAVYYFYQGMSRKAVTKNALQKRT